MSMLVVTIYWPDDPDRGQETYGPFPDRETQDAFATACEQAADEGWTLLAGAHYLLHRVSDPFDPAALWETQDAARFRPDEGEAGH